MGPTQGLGVDERLPVPHAVGELHGQPLGEVDHGGARPASGCLGVGVAHVELLPHAVHADVHGGVAAPLDEVRVPVAGLGHSERTEERGVGKLGPRLTHGVGGGDRTRGEPEVGVVVDRAHRVQGVEAQLGQHMGLLVPQVLEQVARGAGEAAPVRQHVLDGHVRGDVGVGQGEAGKVLDDRIRPVHHLRGHRPPDRASDGRRRQRLGHRRELEDGVGRDLVAQGLVGDAVALQELDLAVVDDRGRQTGDPGPLDDVLDDPVEPGDRRGDITVGDRHQGDCARGQLVDRDRLATARCRLVARTVERRRRRHRRQGRGTTQGGGRAEEAAATEGEGVSGGRVSGHAVSPGSWDRGLTSAPRQGAVESPSGMTAREGGSPELGT